MAKGIIYVMTTGINGLIKIGKTKSDQFNNRMYALERHGYCQATGLKRAFAIEVEDYDSKETLLQTVFAKSRVSDTELFALDVAIAVQLLSSFDGKIIYPKTETKEEIFEGATSTINSKLIPNGTYTLKRKKMSENKTVTVTAVVENGCWRILKNSILGIKDDGNGSKIRYATRASLQIDDNGVLLEDAELGQCSPSFAGSVAMNQSVNGWDEWKNSEGKPIDIYRK
jgi:hypothetical protein